MTKYDQTWAQIHRVKTRTTNTKRVATPAMYINDTRFKSTLRTIKVWLTTHHNWDMSWHLAHK